MRIPLLVAVALLAGCASVDQTAPPTETAAAVPSSVDRAEVRKLVYDFEDAWNRHDMVAFSSLFHGDAEWIHWRGGLWSGKREIYEGHKAIHEAYYRTSQAKVQGIEAMHFLAPSIAYVRVRSDMTGDARYPGETFRYRRTMLLSKRNGKWLIIKGHNTRILGGTGVDWKPTP